MRISRKVHMNSHLIFQPENRISYSYFLEYPIFKKVEICRRIHMDFPRISFILLYKSVSSSQCLNNKPLNQVNKFKYLGVQFSSDGKQDGEIDRRIGTASGVLHSLYRSVMTKAELSKKTKLAIYKSVYRPTLICGHEQWILTEKADLGFNRLK